VGVKTIIQFNGQPREVANGTTIAELLQELDLRPAHVGVEVNLELVPRGKHAEHVLRHGDSVEVVTLVGGG
jgi:sulfur carrier protein